MRELNPILVTGSHRSGSTWAGKTLGQHPQLGYIHEPFNLEYFPSLANVCACRFPYWFTHVSDENAGEYARALAKTLSFTTSPGNGLRHWLQPQIECDRLREAAKIARDTVYFRNYKLQGRRPLMKDPLALFAAEWLAKRFGMDVVVLIRHPAAFVGSIKAAGWTFPFAHFKSQPRLMETYLRPFASEIEAQCDRAEEPVTQAILLWKIFHHAILDYRKQHPEWVFVRYEDLARNPLEQFRSLQRRLDLELAVEIDRHISVYSEKRQGPPDTNSAKVCRPMDSRANIQSWKERLTEKEIARTRAAVEDIACHFYADSEW